MIKISLVCSGGMSTSMLMKKMEEAAIKENMDVTIKAFAISDIENACEFSDIILLGPQIGFQKDNVKSRFPKNKIAVINSLDYGMMNGKKILMSALQQNNLSK